MQLLSLIGKKSYQKQGFLQDGTRVPLSAVIAAGNFITQIKTSDKEGYNSVQLGIGTKKKANKALINHSKKAGLDKTARFLREIRVEALEGLEPGAEISVSEVFQPGDIVDVTGVSKGKGFAGGVKRYHFKGGPRTHGQSDRERAPGSIGQTTTPGRVYKGKRMAGRMGQDTVTVKNLQVIEVTNDGVLLIKGLVPGVLNSYVVVKKVGENKKFMPLYKEVEELPAEELKKEEHAPETLGSSPTPDDVSGNQSETENSNPTSLSKSQSTTIEDNQEVSESALDSSGSGQASDENNNEDKNEKEEIKEEVKENAG